MTFEFFLSNYKTQYMRDEGPKFTTHVFFMCVFVFHLRENMQPLF